MKGIQIQKIIRAMLIFLIAGLPAVVKCQSNTDGSMPQYLFDDFSKSTVRMKNGQVMTPEMNYNTVTGMMVFIKDETYYDLINSELIDTVYLNSFRFIPVGKVFYEVVANGTISGFIEHKGNLLPAGKPVGYGGTSQVASADYVNVVNLSGGQFNLEIPSDYIVRKTSVCWIRKGTEWISFETEKQLLKLFPEKASQIKAYIRENHLKIDKSEQLGRIVRYIAALNN